MGIEKYISLHSKMIHLSRSVLQNNPDYGALVSINKVLHGGANEADDSVFGALEPGELLHFSHAPIVSVEVERAFSEYKALYRSNRKKFKFENLQQIYVAFCNAKRF